MEQAGAVANEWVVEVLRPLRDVLRTWPPVLPSRAGDPILPLKIGAGDELRALLVTPSEEACHVLGRVLRRYTGSGGYLNAILAPESFRHALDGSPVEPVAEAHKAVLRRPKKEVHIVAVQVKAIKVTVALDPLALRPAPEGAPTVVSVTTSEGLRARAMINPRPYRRAVEAIRQHGPENVAVVLQGRMVKLGEIVDAGITVQERKAPVATPGASTAFPKLSLKVG